MSSLEGEIKQVTSDIIAALLPEDMSALTKKIIKGVGVLLVGACFCPRVFQWIVLQSQRSVTLNLGLAVFISVCISALPWAISVLKRRSKRTRSIAVPPRTTSLPAVTQGDRARLLMSINEYISYPNCACAFMIESSPPFQHHWEVSFFYCDENGVEMLLGTGYVCHIQGNGNTHVGMTDQVDRHVDLIQRLYSNDIRILNRCFVRLGKPRGREEETDNGPGI